MKIHASRLTQAIGLVALCGAAAAALQAAAVGRRVYAGDAWCGAGPAAAVVVAGTGAEAIAAMRAHALRGRVLLHFGRFLHFVDDREPLVAATLTRPGRRAALDDSLSAEAGQRDYLWVAASLGIAREIDYVHPPPTLVRRLTGLVLPPDAPFIDASVRGFPRRILRTPSRRREPVVVSVNASWFDEERGEEILESLRRSGTCADLIVIDLAQDADDVTDAARRAALDLADALRKRGGQ